MKVMTENPATRQVVSVLSCLAEANVKERQGGGILGNSKKENTVYM
jgi:hypothetical protein